MNKYLLNNINFYVSLTLYPAYWREDGTGNLMLGHSILRFSRHSMLSKRCALSSYQSKESKTIHSVNENRTRNRCVYSQTLFPILTKIKMCYLISILIKKSCVRFEPTTVHIRRTIHTNKHTSYMYVCIVLL